MTSFKMVAAVAFVALLVPVAAVAQETTIEGPQAVAGSGFFGGELKMTGGEEQRPVRISGRIGYVGFLDLGGDLKVRCAGKGRVKKHETEQGTVVLCAGRGGVAVAKGSHFKLRGFAGRFCAVFPAGTSGVFNGGTARGERPAASERKREAQPKREAEIPTVTELAELLAGLDG